MQIHLSFPSDSGKSKINKNSSQISTGEKLLKLKKAIIFSLVLDIKLKANQQIQSCTLISECICNDGFHMGNW